MTQHKDFNITDLAAEVKLTLDALNAAVKKFRTTDEEDYTIKNELTAFAGALGWLKGTVKNISEFKLPVDRDELMVKLSSRKELFNSLAKQISNLSASIQKLTDKDYEESVKQTQNYKDMIACCTKASELLKRIPPLMQVLQTQTQDQWDHHFGSEEKNVNDKDTGNKNTL